MDETKIIIVIDNRVNRLELMEDIIHRVDPRAQCISFVFGDEALQMINEEMIDAPAHIFIDANLRRTPISSCLRQFRNNAKLDCCCITVFAEIMPMAVADAYCSMGADFAFASPLTITAGVDLLHCILPATRKQLPMALVK